MQKWFLPIRLQRYIFLDADAYLLKLQIDDMILGECGQACPCMLKVAIKT